jgi:preprotein translocase subunit SecA
MFGTIAKKLFGSRNERVLRNMGKIVKDINALEPSVKALSDDALKAKTPEFQKRYQDGEGLDSLLPEVFAVVREVSMRTLGLRHFDVQLIGGMVLHGGNIAEMRTGEGKTLAATLPCYLNAITGKGVHIITVNDYLAKRDSDWMKPIYEFLGLTVGVNLPNMPPEEKKAAYQCDITYGTNNEFGFDYLRDNMVFSADERVQRELYFSIIDEVDSILIDEARTPLIISGAAEDSSELYIKINKIIPSLKKQEEENGPGDYSIDEKQRQAYLTEEGHLHVEELLTKAGLIKEEESLYHASNISLMHHLNAGLRAHSLFQKDVDYIVSNNEVVIVDEHTGRTMVGRRWSDGLHQAIEAKENVAIQNENQTLASITFQNYFRLYDKLSGMTGTADTEAYEFQQIYNLEVVVIPTNKSMVREDFPDLVYLHQKDKFPAIIEDIKDCIKRNQPVLVGTASIESSELVSHLLNKEKIKHQVLNAKFHEKEAHIIAEAGRPGMVTIATNMAGRGTDIVLGGNIEAELDALSGELSEEEKEIRQAEWKKRHQTVLDAGGLRIIGTERHESRRIDNQLRGRSGRQGDPGSSRFYLSFEDNLLRIFGAEKFTAVMQRFGMKEGESIEHPIVSRRIESAQRKVEGHNFDIRKQLLDYDNVANDQRKVIYKQRKGYMKMDDLSGLIVPMREAVIESQVYAHIAPDSMEEEWAIPELEKQFLNDFDLKVPVAEWAKHETTFNADFVVDKVLDLMKEQYKEKEGVVGTETLREFEKSVMLQCLDSHWREHLASMDQLRQGIHLRGYAQKDPKQEYKREAFELFTGLLDSMRHEIVSVLTSVKVKDETDVDVMEEKRRSEMAHDIHYQHDENVVESEGEGSEESKAAPFKRMDKKVGRNEVCPCGSGKKYKQCHGKLG